ncbi:MAG: hypothetical protein OEX07_13770 [Gammaproteobacteria bacterium]|nr:hypothetical protein [Gammaproteobacteria bacterium]
MIKFTEALSEWHTPMFADILQKEIKKLSVDQLHLQQAMSYGSYASADHMKIIILSIADDADTIQAKVGVFFSGLIPGCRCDDDPTPANQSLMDQSITEQQNEYCELQFDIHKLTAETTVSLLP